jgi:parallel beta-helix repeat protein
LKQFSIEDFTSELDTIPYLVQNRNATIFSLMDNNPLPFNVNPTVLTPNGVYFSWTEAITNFPATISYKLQIADNYQFTQNLITINNITDNNITFSNLTSGLKHWRVYAKTETGNQTRCIAFFKTFDIPDSAFSGTEFSGIIDSSTIFTLEGSPYSFPEGLTVAEGCTLAVEAGVLMGIGANRSLRVEGILNILGTVDDSIRIIPLSMNEPWGMIVVAESAEVNISFANIFKGGIDSSGGICDLIQTDSGGVVNLSDCRLSEGDGRALYALKGSVSIERCEITDFALGAMLISGGSAKVIDCFIDRCCLNTDSCDIIFIEEIIDSMEIRGNNIYKGGDDAISLRNVQGGVINGNFISGANDKGINLHNSSMGTNIFNNIVERCDEGIAIQDDSYATIFNNVLVLNDEGLSFKDFDNDAGAFVRNCVIWENDIDIMNGEWVNLDIGYCSIGENNPFPGTGNIYDDPKFIDPWNNYYYPEAESPLIDAGYGTDYPIFDLLDSIRVDILDVYNTGAGQVNYVDIGVYEYYSQDGFIIPPYLLPNTFGLGNYPNPFNTSTRIRFYLDNPGKAELKIFNVLGGLILEEEFQAQTPGWVIYNWEAKKGERDLSSGIYFCWLRFGHGTNAIKMVLIK